MKIEKTKIIIKLILQAFALYILGLMISILLPILSSIKWYYIILSFGIILINNYDNLVFFVKGNEINRKNLFNIYYINYQKVFEICMLINNKIGSSIEKGFRNEYYKKKASSLNGEAKNGIFSINPTINEESQQTKTYEYKELQEIKNTNSTFLKEIIDISTNKSLKELHNGDLIKVDNVDLDIINKEELAQINSMMSGILKGNVISTYSEGQKFNFDINAISNLLLKDYKYHLKGTNEFGESFYISIPMKPQNEFENNYSIYDLEIGKVNIIGIYKTDNFNYKNNMNTFRYLQNLGEQQTLIAGDELHPSEGAPKNNKLQKDDITLPYIDLIAIIQDLDIKEGNKNE